jgi:hypothetical protein
MKILESFTLKKERWLTALSQNTPGSRPVPLQSGSLWKGPISAVLIFDDGITVLNDDGNRDVIPYESIASATITEDIKDHYSIQLLFSSLAPEKAVFLVKGTVFFMIIFLALNQKGVGCMFSFTERRLRAMGAATSK